MSNMKEAVSVFDPKIARGLLKKGYTIIDIKPLKECPKGSIFIFKNEGNLKADVFKLNHSM